MSPHTVTMPAVPEAPAELPSSATASPTGMTEEEVIGITSVGHTLCHVGELIFAGATPVVIGELGLKEFHATSLPLLGYVLMGLGAIPVGAWADAWGPRRVLLVYFIALAGTSLAVALAPNIALLIVALTGMGLALSIYHPTAVSMISLGVKARGRALGINGVAGSIGVALGPFLGMLAASVGLWRLAYVVVAALALAAALFMRRIEKRSRSLAPEGQTPHALPPTAEGPRQSFLRYLPLAFLMLAMMLGGFNYRCLVTALPPFLSGDGTTGHELARGGVFVFIALVVGGVGQYLGGSLADRVGGRRIYLGLIALLVLLAAALASLQGSPLALLTACGLAVCLFAQQPVENSILADCTTTARRSMSYGVKFALTFGLGATGAYITGLIWHAYGTPAPVFYLIAGSAATMGLLLLGFIVTSKRQQTVNGPS